MPLGIGIGWPVRVRELELSAPADWWPGACPVLVTGYASKISGVSEGDS